MAAAAEWGPIASEGGRRWNIGNGNGLVVIVEEKGRAACTFRGGGLRRGTFCRDGANVNEPLYVFKIFKIV